MTAVRLEVLNAIAGKLDTDYQKERIFCTPKKKGGIAAALFILRVFTHLSQENHLLCLRILACFDSVKIYTV